MNNPYLTTMNWCRLFTILVTIWCLCLITPSLTPTNLLVSPVTTSSFTAFPLEFKFKRYYLNGVRSPFWGIFFKISLSALIFAGASNVAFKAATGQVCPLLQHTLGKLYGSENCLETDQVLLLCEKVFPLKWFISGLRGYAQSPDQEFLLCLYNFNTASKLLLRFIFFNYLSCVLLFDFQSFMLFTLTRINFFHFVIQPLTL